VLAKDLLLIEQQLQDILHDFSTQVDSKKNSIFVIGCSTSEVIGERIGTAGTLEVASLIYRTFEAFAKKQGVVLAYQCCEHLNRALVVEADVADLHMLEEVAVIPIRHAGGAIATYAYEHMKKPVIVESIRALGGIDIGDTFIGMHLKQVVVPIRTSINQLGNAHVTLATTRPKLIGCVRAIYEQDR
jgi:uncharacterized protein (TIGR01440 family)